MPSEAQVDRVEQFFEDIRRLGGQAEQTAILTNLTVIDAAPVGLTGRIIIQDPRDGDFIPALTVPGINYNTGDLVNVLFVAGTEPVAYQQGSGSGTANVQVDRLWESDFAAVAWSTDATGNLSAAGAYNITSTGDLNINDINASGNVLLSAGGAIIGGTGSSNPTIGASASGNRIGNIFMASATFINGLGTLDISSGAIGSDITMVGLANAAQDTLDLGDVAGTGDVDIDFSNGQMFLEGSSGKLGLGTITIPHGGTGAAMLALDGADSSVNGPHIQLTTATDNHPVFQLLAFTHDNMTIAYDAYYDGSFRSSDAGSNAYLRKLADRFDISRNSGTAQGSVITWKAGISMDLTDAKVGINILASSVLAQLHVDQSSTAAAIPVLYLDQADISEEMIEFNTTIGVGNAIEAVGAKTLTPTHFIKVTIPGGLTRYFQVGTIA